MSEEPAPDFQGLFERMQGGDADARRKLVSEAYERLRRLAHKILREDFPDLRGGHDTTSVTNEAVLRLLKALGQVQPATLADFFSFAAVQIRRVLLDMVRKKRRGAVVGGPEQDVADDTLDPAELACWTEFHEQVDKLPEEERKMVELCLYLGLTRGAAAKVLGIHEKKASRRWLRAIRRLPGLPG
jgi:RNA polymerase sigma-70 factor (ECF subfamily)